MKASDKVPEILALLPTTQIDGERLSFLEALGMLARLGKEPAFADIPEARAAIPVIRTTLRDNRFSRIAIEVLGHIGPEAAVGARDILEAQKKNESYAKKWLGVGDETNLKEEAKAVQHNARRALYLMGEPGIAQLAGALSCEDSEIRRIAAVDLGELGPIAKNARDPLRRLLDEADSNVRDAAAEALKKIDAK